MTSEAERSQGPMPLWFIHDPETMRVEIDVPAAAEAGAGRLTVSYDEETNRIDVEVTRARKEDA